jgi:flavin-dependent dehydrogenase
MPLDQIRNRYDVVIAGARVAGASTAMLLARQGLRVLAIDPLRKGSDTLSTHALMRAGVLQLHRWGLLDELRSAGTPRIQKTTFVYGDDPITVAIKPRDGVDGLYAPRRTILDPILVDSALAAGAQVVHGLAATGLVRDGDGRVRGVEVVTPDRTWKRVEADLVIGADGVRSRIARLVGASTMHQVPHATASIYGYVPGLEIDEFQWYYGERLAVGAIPTNDGETCIFASMSPERFRAERGEGLADLFQRVVRSVSTELAERVAAAGPTPRLRGFAGAPSVLRASVGPGWALVGDAGYFKDPLTAHGITDALRDAELLARAATEGSDDAFRGYQTTRDHLARGLMDVTDEIASLRWTLDEVKELHLQLSRAMSAEVDVILEWDRALVPA